jgi:Fe-S-cluster-containing dehydrogenase component
MTACPELALYKDDSGLVQRAVNLCVACHTCVAACPFGTLMNEFFESRKSICDYCDMDNDTKALRCVETCPKGALELVEYEPDHEQHIYQLEERVLIKDHPWEVLVQT